MTTYRGIFIVKNITRTLSVIAILAIALTGFSWKISTANAGPGKRATAANAPIRPEAYRIGVVNRKKAFDDYEKQQAAWAKLEKERETKQAVVDKQSDAIIAAQKKLAEDKTMSQTDKETVALKIQEDTLDYQNAFQKLQNEINVRANRFFADMMKEVDASVQAVGSAGNYHLIFEADPNPRSGSAVLYFSATIDITPQVIQHLNSGR